MAFEIATLWCQKYMFDSSRCILTRLGWATSCWGQRTQRPPVNWHKSAPPAKNNDDAVRWNVTKKPICSLSQTRCQRSYTERPRGAKFHSVYTRTASQEMNLRSASEQTSDGTQHLTVCTWVILPFSTAGMWKKWINKKCKKFLSCSIILLVLPTLEWTRTFF